MARESDPFYDVRDRFPWLTPIEIAEQCYALARELRRKGVRRTAEQRLEIALNVAAILTRVAERITGSPYSGSWTPEKSCVRNVGLVRQSFLEWLEVEAKSARRRALDRAAALVLGQESGAWIRACANESTYARMWLVGGEPELVTYLTELDIIVDARAAASEQPFDFQRPRPIKRKWYEIMPGDPDCHIRADGTIDKEKRRALYGK